MQVFSWTLGLKRTSSAKPSIAGRQGPAQPAAKLMSFYDVKGLHLNGCVTGRGFRFDKLTLSQESWGES